jgi:pimeloyl-ACP methyl ester carboxylesterase
VLGFPGADAIYQRSFGGVRDRINVFSFIMRSGRALLYPIYKSTFERGDGLKSDISGVSAGWRDHMIMWAKDVGRSVDYLESRPDMAQNRIGYMGVSWGGELAPLFLAVEPRISLAVLYVAGFNRQPALPEADPVNFAPLVKVPVLMLNGRYDFFYPTATSQEPMFKLLGTPAEHKRHLLYDAAHRIPRNEMIKQAVDWMEKYWGEPTH